MRAFRRKHHDYISRLELDVANMPPFSSQQNSFRATFVGPISSMKGRAGQQLRERRHRCYFGGDGGICNERDVRPVVFASSWSIP